MGDFVIYTIHAYRWGSHENHSYIVTICFDKKKAIKIAKDHEIYRGDKYECEVIEWIANNDTFDKKEVVKEISGSMIGMIKEK